MGITIDAQTFTQTCPGCGADFTVVRGAAYEGGRGRGLYLIALHGHSPEGRLAHLAVALLDDAGGEQVPLAAAMDVTATPEQFRYSLVEWEWSPWRGEEYLGQMLAPDVVRASPLRAEFFRLATAVVNDNPEVQSYFAEPHR